MRRIPRVETADSIRLTDAADTAFGQRREHVVGCKEPALFIEEVTVPQGDMRSVVLLHALSEVGICRDLRLYSSYPPSSL